MKVLMMIIIAISVCIIYDIRSILSKNFPKYNNLNVIEAARIVALMVSLICGAVYYFI